MKQLYKSWSINSKYSKLEVTKQFVKLSRGISSENYDVLLEQYIVLIDNDVKSLYKKINSQARFSNTLEIEEFLNKREIYAKMKILIDEKLGSCNRKSISSILFTLFRNDIYSFNI